MDIALTAGDYIAILSVFASLFVAFCGGVFTLIGALIAWGMKTQLNAIRSHLARHDNDINKVCDTMEKLGKQMVVCIEQLKTLFSRNPS